MPKQIFPGAPVAGKDSPVSILWGRIIDVDMKRYTATVWSDGAKRKFSDVPIGSPYTHYQRGEGFYVIPDVGATCWIATEGSGGSPVILGFSNLPKPVSSSEQADPDAAPAPEDEIQPSYGYRRPQRVPGEFGFTTRDGSFLHFRRGGIVELGSSGACQRIFLPLRNLITDVSENFQQWTAAGRLVFDTDRREGETGDTAKAKWRLLVKAGAKDAAASVLLEAGKLDNDRYHLVIKENAIDLADGTYTSTGSIYEFIADLSGNITEKAGTVTRTCSQYTLDVSGSMTEESGVRQTTVNGVWTIDANGMIIIGCTPSVENLLLGGGDVGAFLLAVAAHKHPESGGGFTGESGLVWP